MKALLSYVAERAGRLHAHRLFEWVDSDAVERGAKLAVLPSLANFTMGFRDLNKWVLRYPHPNGELEAGIDLHTFEDQTHSRLFLEDWRRLGLDKRLGWRASDTLWWLFLAQENEVPRAQGAYLRALAVADGGDPLLRFAHSEVIEACGSVFFEHFASAAEALSVHTGVEYRYMGPYHLARESGHMDCEDLFESQQLDEDQRARALRLVDAMFGLFEEFFDSVLRYARGYAARDLAARPLLDANGSRSGCAADEHWSADATPPPPACARIDPSQESLQCLLEARRERVARHAFYLWLRETGADAPLLTLRRFIPLWAIEIMGYRDLVWYAMRYETPLGELECAVNRWVSDLQAHSTLFLADWRQLDLDRLLGWSASDTLEFYFLDGSMDPHRRNFIRFTEMAAANPDPVLRLWLIEALEATGWDFFAHTAALATTVETADGLRLDYLAGRHHVAHESSKPSQPVVFKDRPLDAIARETIAAMIDTAFDAMEEHLTISLEVAISDRFAIMPREAGKGPRWSTAATPAR